MIIMLLYQMLASVLGKVYKTHRKTINFKYQFLHKMKSLNYMIDHILCQIFKITFNIFLKKHEEKTNNPSIYVSKIGNGVTFKHVPHLELK